MKPSDRNTIREMEKAESLPPRVLSLASEGKSGAPSSILEMAEGAAETCRRLRFDGYDLKYISLRCYLLRNDGFLEPEADATGGDHLGFRGRRSER